MLSAASQMYALRFGMEFARRLIQAGLSSLDTFIAYFQWQASQGRSALVFTERVADNEKRRLFISVAAPTLP